MSRRQKHIPNADQVLNEFVIDKDIKKVNNAISLLERRFYDSLYPEINGRDTINDRFSRLLAADDALRQKEKLELFLLGRDVDL